jgi:hypothetical protein
MIGGFVESVACPKFLGGYTLLSIDREGIVAMTEDCQESLEYLAWTVGQS